ncbi:hypothetical protein IBX38_00010 [Candidatus Bathyarchaeota archaeon]|nr:hypothetical protein [Candidatus Bathyarchaeota archaeon]
MANQFRRKLLFITVFLVILLSYSAYAFLIPSVHAAEISTQEKGLAILNDVVGLDLTEYAAETKEYPQDLYLGILPQDIVDYTLESNESMLRVACTFVNKTLQLIYVSDCDGSPPMTQPVTSVLEMAEGFLSRYYAYSGALYIQEMRSMVDKIDINKNITKTSGNMTLEVIVNQIHTEFIWTFTFNGVQASSKRVSLGFEKGFLKHFIDRWWLYKIDGTDINVDENEAIEIAMNAAKNYSWKVCMGNDTIEVTEFNIVEVGKPTLCFLNAMEEKDARGGDPLTLYPEWYIPLGLDKVYPGGVTGINVGIWADIKEVSYIGAMIFGGAPSSPEAPVNSENSVKPPSNEVSVGEVAPNQTLITWVALPILIAIALGATTVYFRRKKTSRLDNVPKSMFETWRSVLLLIPLTIVSIPIPTANAEPLPEPGGSAITYASTYYQLDYERTAAQQICTDMASRFGQEGYEVTNAYDTGTIKSNVLSWASSKEQGFHRVAIFHFGHGGFLDVGGYLHYDYFDSNGNTIWDYEIYPKTGLGKHFFVFIWTCRQGDLIGYVDGNGRAVGMPYAWTHTNSLSSNGYSSPDSGLYCFIGFENASPALAYRSFRYYTVLAKDFILKFYYYALSLSYSIKDALNLASLYWFGCSFIYCPLYQGFETWWPGNFPGGPPAKWDWGKMRVYGNGDIHLNQYSFKVLAADQYGNYFVNRDVYIDIMHNLANTGSTIDITGGYHTVFVNDFWEPGSTGNRSFFKYYTYGYTKYYLNPAYWYFWKDWTVTAVFELKHCPGDVNGDGIVDIDDAIIVSGVFGSIRGDPEWTSIADLNCDGIVDIDDALIVAINFGEVYW